MRNGEIRGYYFSIGNDDDKVHHFVFPSQAYIVFSEELFYVEISTDPNLLEELTMTSILNRDNLREQTRYGELKRISALFSEVRSIENNVRSLDWFGVLNGLNSLMKKNKIS